MFFVFGWGRQTVKKYGPVNTYHCNHCNNDEYWTLFSRKTWFTLFFIPVIPYSTEYLLLCPICSHGVQLDSAKFNELKAIAECNSDLFKKKISKEQYDEKIRLLVSTQNVQDRSPEEPGIAKRTETQINYLKQMQEIENERRKIPESGINEN